MNELPHSVSRCISEIVGSDPQQAAAAGGGCISSAALVSLADGRSCFVKWKRGAQPGFFAAEADGLAALRETRAVRVPQVYGVRDSAELPCIILEALEPARRGGSAQAAELGRALAKLHALEHDQFGWHRDNFIGELPQINAACASWGEFFFERRLTQQAEFAAQRGWFSAALKKLLESRRRAVIEVLNEHQPWPSLLHGDLWSGNVHWGADGPAVIDPAVYCGCREADLAMTECFGRFAEDFYRAYSSELPLAPGYSRRREILNLYHLMNHANIFGGGYISSATSALQRLPQ